jgi:pimeloyl-ACP methyl ester carboxylesterase
MIRKLLIALLVLIVLAAGLFFWGVAKFRSEPIATLESMSRITLRAYGADRHEISTSAGKLVYFTVGSGPTVVLVHGANDQAGLWSRTVARLRSDYRFVIPDMPGHGESDPPTGAIPFELLLEGLDAVVDAESGGQPVAIAGNSLGGWLAQIYTLEHPERVRALVLENSGGLSVPDYSGPSLMPTNREEARAAFRATIVRSGSIPDYVVDDFVRRAPNSQVARMAAEPFDRWLLDDRLAELSLPVTLIWGEKDGVLPLDYAQRLAAAIPGAELRTIPDCGHIPHNECPDEFARELSGALGR